MTNINFLKTTLILHQTRGYEKCFSVFQILLTNSLRKCMEISLESFCPTVAPDYLTVL